MIALAIGDYWVTKPELNLVFYNGTDKKIKGERTKLRLSDAFEQENKTGDFEWTATLIDINYGANKVLMERCVTLKHYSIFIHKVRIYNNEYKDLTKAIDRAVDECIPEGILVEFLTKMKGEVRNVLLEEFDEERAIKSWNYAMDKMQNEISHFKSEIQHYQSENQRYQSENQNNIIEIVSLLRQLGHDNEYIRQALISKHNIPEDKIDFYLKQ